ncbi:unnamed protein product [Rotaria sp. Silwood2]|nr:unnamed protein product [Rotaria sp. Silwood2]CAF4390743.1 unnamed protein product [Rotaria sp. Silwood2]
MFRSLPSDVLNYQDDNFYQIIKERCGDDVLEFMKVLGISSVQSLLGVENLFDWLQFNSEKLKMIKNKLAFQHDDGFVEVKWGIQNSLERLIRDLQTANGKKQQAAGSTILHDDDVTLSSIFLQKHPVLKSLINYYQTIDNENNENNSEDISFLTSFLDNISNNLCRSKNTYRYNESVLRFAISFYILSGKMAYEFVRRNIPGALPALTTVQKLISNTDSRINEADFRFNSLKAHMNSLNTTIAFASEDCTAVIKKISYDSLTNSFVGFVTPSNNGIPLDLHYQTDSFEQLREWFSTEDRSPLLNIHMIQPITKMQMIPNPFLLCAFGTNNQYESIDIIRRWIWTFEQSLLKNVRIIGFSTDGDPKYLRVMRLITGFFASLPNIKLSSYRDAFHVNIPKEWDWYFLNNSQLFLCFQDATRLCTKLRNRLLSRVANLLIGNSCISINHLSTLIENVSKLRHGLVKSDIYPNDRQNFNSCIKICSEAVINSLMVIPNTEGTIMYLRLLRSIMIAYIDKDTTSIDRLYHAWFSVFISRWWYMWLEHMSKVDLDNHLYKFNDIVINQEKKNDKRQFFITNSAYHSIEINAHQLTYLALLVIEKKLPPEAMNIYLFSSQTCEGMFRSARSMSGTFSSVVNFSIQEFLSRAQKLSLLHKIKTESEFSSTNDALNFPKHYKQGKKLQKSANTIPNNNVLNAGMITKIVSQAFTDATKLLSSFQLKEILDEKNIINMNQLSNSIRKVLNKKVNSVDYSNLYEETDEISNSEYELDVILDSESYIENEDQQFDDEQDDTSSVSSNGVLYGLQGATFSGMWVFDKVRAELAKSYFEVEIDGKRKFIHKQTACWLLTENKAALSNDRLTRVMQK